MKKFKLKNLMIWLFAMFFSLSSFGQVITIGSTPGNDYVTINNALNALAISGISGHTTFLLDAQTFNEHVIINPIAGSGPNAILTFKGHGDSTKITFAGTSTDKTIFSIRGADYITIDSIFIEGTGSYAFGIHFTDTAEHINIVNSHIKVPTSTIHSNIYAITTGTISSYSSYGYHVNDLTISNNIVEGGYNGINIQGSGDSINSRATNFSINNNTLSNTYYTPLYIKYCDYVEISNNTITSTAGYFFGIYCNYNDHTNITHNNISGSGTGTHHGIYISNTNKSSSPFRGQITNNTIIFNGTYSGHTYGINHYNSCNNDFVNNTVIIGPNYTSTSSFGLYSYNSKSTRVINNNFVNLGRGYAIYNNSTDTSYITKCDNNNYYCPNSTNLIYYGGDQTSLAAMQNASTYDDFSLNVNPNFASNIDAHIMSPDLDGAAIPWSGVIYDMDMEIRDVTNPDIGADEFDYRTKDLTITNLVNPVTSMVIGQNVYPNIEIRNLGLDSIFSYDVNYQINSGAVITESCSDTLSFYDINNYTFTTEGIYAPSAPFLLTIWIDNVTGDVNLNNDTISTTVTVIPPDNDASITNTHIPLATPYLAGELICPSIEIKNFGINPITSCDISYKFNDGIMVTETYNGNLLQNQTATFTFTIGSLLTVNTTDIVINTSLTGDTITSNDTSKVNFVVNTPLHDAGITDILYPHASPIVLGSMIYPQIELANYGINTETSIDVTYIYGMNTITETWTGSLAPGATIPYTFTQGFIFELANQRIKTYSSLTSDVIWSNDTLARPISYSVNNLDVALTDISDPSVNTYIGQNVCPTVTIFNVGIITQNSFDVTYVVNGGTPVTETWTGALTYQTSTTFTFNTPFVAPTGTYSLCVYTQLTNDALLANDTAFTSITSIAPTIDVGISSIASPNSTDIVSYYNTASVWIYNYGTNVQSSIPVTYQIDALTPVLETWVGNLPYGDSVLFTFTTLFESTVDYQFCAVTNLSSDQVIDNDGNCLSVVIGIGENIAQDISLEQNIPNPATNNTLINFNVPNNGTAVLAIRDLQGRLIYTEKSNVLAGSNSFSINTENYASGLYLYTLNFNGVSLSKKMNIQK